MGGVRRGTFGLPGAPDAAMGWFTPEGERAWVDGWDPVYCSGATDGPARSGDPRDHLGDGRPRGPGLRLRPCG